VVLAGCGKSDAPADSANPAPAQSTGDTSDAEPDRGASTNSARIESAALKQAMLDVTLDLMKKQDPNTDPDAVRTQVESAIAQIRKDVPDFLMLSGENEKKLQAGTQVEGVDKRITEAEAFLNDTGIQLTGLVASLLPQHKAGTLSPVGTELLAHLIVADMKKTKAALTE
tara:strand:- start:52 stop:561 length:510 start_codon:yes stop_codon:yes gene_type:complete